AYAGQLDQHRKIDARDHLNVRLLHDRDRQVGRRAAEHVGEQDDAGSGIGPGNRRQDFGAAFLDIIVGADGNRLDLTLRADHMLHCGAKLHRQAAVGDEYKSDHSDIGSTAGSTVQAATLSPTTVSRYTEPGRASSPLGPACATESEPPLLCLVDFAGPQI